MAMVKESETALYIPTADNRVARSSRASSETNCIGSLISRWCMLIQSDMGPSGQLWFCNKIFVVTILPNKARSWAPKFADGFHLSKTS